MKLSKDALIKNGIVLLLIAGFLVWQKLDTTTTAQLVLEGVSKENFQGTVDSVFRDKGDHNAKRVRLTTGYVYGLYPEWESKIDLGDSLSKIKGSVKVAVFKRNGVKIELNYNKLVADWKP